MAVVVVLPVIALPVADAVTAGLPVWTGAAAAGLAVFLVTRTLCERIRRARWESGADALAGRGGGAARQQS